MPEPGKVLLVDDEADILAVASKRLQAAGYTVLTAQNGPEGLKLARAEHPDVILLDIMMPKMDGLEVLKTLRAEGATKDIPVIMLTARGAERDMQASIELGAVYHMAKPYQPNELLEEVARALQRHHLKHGQPPA